MLEAAFCRRGTLNSPWLTGVLIVVLYSSSGFGQQTSEELTRRFLDEAPRGWQEYQSWAEGLDGTVTVSRKLGDKQLLHAHLEYKHNSRCKMRIHRNLLPHAKWEGKLLAYNPAYTFTLQRETATNPWAVTEVKKLDEEVASAVVQELDSPVLLRSAIRIYKGQLVGDIIGLPAFRVLRATAVNRDGMELVQVEFDNVHPMKEPGKKFCPIQSGTMLLDPNRFWYLRSCELRCKFGDGEVIAKVENELADPSAKYPLLKRRVTTEDIEDPEQGRLIQKHVNEFDLHQASRLPPDEDFTLTAFGFPEPFDVPRPRKWTHWYVWTGVGGVLCLVAGLLVLRFRRQRAA
jgi:hypothetical protein